MSNENLRRLHRQLVLAEESEAMEVVEQADPERDARIVNSVLKTLRSTEQEPPSPRSTPGPLDQGALPPPVLAPPRGHGAPGEGTGAWWHRSRTEVAVILTGLAMMLAIFVQTAYRNHPGTPPLHPIAKYQMVVPGDQPTAGSEPLHPPTTQVPKFTLDSVLQVELRPAHRVDDEVEVEAQAFLRHDGQLFSWPVSLSRSLQGTFLLRGPVSTMPLLGPGRWELIFAIGAHKQLPSQSELLRQLSTSPIRSTDSVQLVSKLIDISPAPARH